MNASTQTIIALLPNKPLLTPAEVAAAYGLKTTAPILADVKAGKIPANRVGKQYIISRAAAEAYVAANEYIPNEGSI